ncbi:hypothetical protein Taro_041050 [Colocasia esculenta]|uniref:Uncharacterized protein n=1 Tax=Colocasia esculenta TaxID=4460 RepID=A0A843WW80_COLES|nr:hypothetical protein [Colocasia esculenta]
MASSKFAPVQLVAVVLLLSLVLTAESSYAAGYSKDQGRGEDCVFAGPCKSKADCAGPCKRKGLSPTAVLCAPYIGGLTCCCLT